MHAVSGRAGGDINDVFIDIGLFIDIAMIFIIAMVVSIALFGK